MLTTPIQPRRMWAVFHAEEVTDTDPQPIAAFLTEGEARGWVLMACGHIDPAPVVRPADVYVTIAPSVTGEEAT